MAIQSHTYACHNLEASNAVNGNTATCTRTKDIGPTCQDQTVWWKMDLGWVYNINFQFKNYDGMYYNGILDYLTQYNKNSSAVWNQIHTYLFVSSLQNPIMLYKSFFPQQFNCFNNISILMLAKYTTMLLIPFCCPNANNTCDWKLT